MVFCTLNRLTVTRRLAWAHVACLCALIAGAALVGGTPALAQEPLPDAPPPWLAAPSRADQAALTPGLLLAPETLPSIAAEAAPAETPDTSSANMGAPALHSWQLAEPDAADLITCCRHFLPNALRAASPAMRTVSPLPRLVDGGFDAGGAAWQQTMLQACPELAETPFELVAQTSTLGSYLDNDPFNGISLPVETTDSYVVWLGGGGGNKDCSLGDPLGLAVTHRLVQQVTLPADYGVRLQFDALVQSAEGFCGVDVAQVLANGVPLSLNLPLCTAAEIQQWTERSVDLSALRGQTIGLEFRVSANESNNSNLWLDNVALCGLDARLPVADQCPSGAWQEPTANSAQRGGISASPQRSYDPTIAVSPVGRPYIAWADQSAARNVGEIYVRRWNGVVWEPVGTGSASGGGVSNTPNAESAHPVVTVSGAVVGDAPASRAGLPYIAWHDGSTGDTEIYIRQWNGGGWVPVGAGSASGGGISNNFTQSFRTTLAIDNALLPVLAWTDSPAPGDSNTEIYAKRFNGTAWVQVGSGSASGGGVSNTAGESGDAALAAGPGGTLWLAWSDSTSGDAEIYVKRWTGATWDEASPGSASGGGISNNSDASFAPAIAVGADGLPVVAWVDRSGGDTEIYLRKFDGDSWEPLGASASGGGLSSNNGASIDPSVAVNALGQPLVAWSDLSGFNADIYVRRWNGSTWAQVGSGSALLGGVSHTNGFSGEPVVAIGRDGRVSLAWSDDTPGQGEIYVRRYGVE